MAATHARRPGDRRDQILDAAAEAFGRRGFDGVTVAELAESVGVTAPALYRHFGAKDQILSAVTTGTLDRLVVVAESHIGVDGLDQLTRDLTTEVLDRPWQVVAYLRERHRWAADTTRPTQREVELFGAIDQVIDRAVAGLTAGDRRCRMIAMVGVLRGVAERAPRLSRPAADAFIADAVTAVLRAAPVRAINPGRLHPSNAATWRLPPSPRERILAAALPLFRSRGFDGVGIGEIGDHAGVGASNVSRYFGSKEEVLVDIYDRVGARVEVAVDDAVASASDADHALQNLLEAYTEVAFGAADLVVVVGENRGALPRNEIARLRRRDRRVADIWRGVIAALRPELRPVETTTVVAGVIALVNSFPRHEPDALPDPSAVVPLARAFVGAG
ncbi:MAG: TetR/AcrR family transcriptional regulator [Microthrixaceae bacterium]|nr:TetR/AcrR family transcriptional regulator [Microthrixaceae bacterium]MCO5306283.1 TetR/AcrR family transcriptional regulator [Microthrixaceae bacterium]